jgi:predicted acyltransferase (DUF342 family)
LVIAEDLSLNNRLFVSGDVSLNRRVFVGGDSSFNGNFNVSGNTTLGGLVPTNVTVTLPQSLGPMTSNTTALSSGTFVASGSPNTFPAAYNAFDGISTTYWGTTFGSYSGGPYNTGYGSSTIIGGTTYNGEWVQLQFPNPILITGINASVGASITQFYLAGSLDTNTWTLLTTSASAIAGGGYSAGPVTTVGVTTATSYTYYRLIVNATDTGPFTSIYELGFNTNGIVFNALNSTSTTTGAVVVTGGVGVSQNLNVGGSLVTSSDVSLNRRLFVGGDASFNSRIYVTGDASFNSRLFVVGDVSLNNRLIVAGNTNIGGATTVIGNITGGNITTSGTLSTTGTGALSIAGIASVTGALTVTGNITGGNISTAGAATVTGNITGGNITTTGTLSTTGTGTLSIAGNATLNGNLTLNRAVENLTSASSVGTAYTVNYSTSNNAIYFLAGVTGNITLTYSNFPQIGNTSITTTFVIQGAAYCINSFTSFPGSLSALGGGGATNINVANGSAGISLTGAYLVVQSVSIFYVSGTFYGITNISPYF